VGQVETAKISVGATFTVRYISYFLVYIIEVIYFASSNLQN